MPAKRKMHFARVDRIESISMPSLDRFVGFLTLKQYEDLSFQVWASLNVQPIDFPTNHQAANVVSNRCKNGCTISCHSMGEELITVIIAYETVSYPRVCASKPTLRCSYIQMLSKLYSMLISIKNASQDFPSPEPYAVYL